MTSADDSSIADVPAIYVAARRVLLDALTALAPQGAAVIVAGAQAVYLRAGAADIAVAPYTSDGDLALNPSLLVDEPTLDSAMLEADFSPSLKRGHVEPGIWVASAVVDGEPVLIPVDLIVPEGAASGGGRRGARLGIHGNAAARRAVGLEAALVDHSPMKVAALGPGDMRSVEVEVAGHAALLVSKAHKLHDRLASGNAARVDDKDAADVFRLMQTTGPESVGTRLATLARDPLAGAVTDVAITYLGELFARRGRPGIEMATRALRIGVPGAQVESLCVSYARRLIAVARGEAT